jgi:hypothetical protein
MGVELFQIGVLALDSIQDNLSLEDLPELALLVLRWQGVDDVQVVVKDLNIFVVNSSDLRTFPEATHLGF